MADCHQKKKVEFVYSLTFRSSATLDLLGVRAYVVDDLTLEVGHLEVPSFTHDIVLNTAELVELEGTVTRFDYLHPQ